jgi:hypothetical protein
MTSRRTFSLLAVTALVTGGLLIPQTAQARPARLAVPVTSTTGSTSRGAAHDATAARTLFGGPGTWTKFSSGIVDPGAQLSLLRTADGHLHVAWVKKNKANDLGVASTTFSLAGSLQGTSMAINHWLSLDQTLALVPDGKDIRLIFNGAQDNNPSNKFNLSARYTATSANGNAWSLIKGSLSSHTVFNLPISATVKSDGVTPVSVSGENAGLEYHVGVDSSIPATTPDTLLTHAPGYFLGNDNMVRDNGGSIYLAWYESSNTTQGYWIQRILPTKGSAMLAPHSKDVSLPDNEPFGPVAVAARVGGGVYYAYCSPSKSLQCAHIYLWKVGSAAPKVVPGLKSGEAVRHVAIAGGPKGRIVVGWFDSTKNVLQVVRTNTHGTSWGVVRSIKLPVPTNLLSAYDGLYLEGSSGRIDVVANLTRNTTPTLYHTQVLEGLKVTASPTKASHAHATTITFRVTDAGETVAGATVTFLGHTAHTDSHGVAKITIAKGQKKGTKTATASKSLYYKATVSVKIT